MTYLYFSGINTGEQKFFGFGLPWREFKQNEEQKMKKILTFALVLFLFMVTSACAATAMWDRHTDERVVGYTLYWKEQGGAEEFRKTLTGIDSTHYTIEDKFFKIGVVYELWVTCHTNQVQSDPSTKITFTRDLVFTPPVDNLPTEEYSPDAVTTVNNVGINNN